MTQRIPNFLLCASVLPCLRVQYRFPLILSGSSICAPASPHFSLISRMKIVAISDTHGQHRQLKLPPGELLIHAGDVSGRGHRQEILDFLDWFGQQDYRYKVFIAGNHDFFFERETAETISALIPPGVIYLNDSGVEIEGLQLWGSPIQPWFFDWAFNRQRGTEIDQHWQLIPPQTDILITHGPPQGILDRTSRGEIVGCEQLLQRVQTIAPRFQIFGHIHEAYGQQRVGPTTFVNASVLNLRYQLAHAPVSLEWSCD